MESLRDLIEDGIILSCANEECQRLAFSLDLDGDRVERCYICEEIFCSECLKDVEYRRCDYKSCSSIICKNCYENDEHTLLTCTSPDYRDEYCRKIFCDGKYCWRMIVKCRYCLKPKCDYNRCIDCAKKDKDYDTCDRCGWMVCSKCLKEDDKRGKKYTCSEERCKNVICSACHLKGWWGINDKKLTEPGVCKEHLEFTKWLRDSHKNSKN